MISERDVIERERAAYMAASEERIKRACFHYPDVFELFPRHGDYCPEVKRERARVEAEAAEKFPFTRPREVTVTWSDGRRMKYRVVDGILYGTNEYNSWDNVGSRALHTVDTIKALAELIDNPSEIVR